MSELDKIKANNIKLYGDICKNESCKMHRKFCRCERRIMTEQEAMDEGYNRTLAFRKVRRDKGRTTTLVLQQAWYKNNWKQTKLELKKVWIDVPVVNEENEG